MEVSATRGFAGPYQFPPQEFAAYGILAFKHLASRFDRDRHLMICEAYLRTIPHTGESETAEARQMVTIWPIRTDEMADELNARPIDGACEDAVTHYGLVHAQKAIDTLTRQGPAPDDYDPRAPGPLLIAWTPTENIPEGSVALFLDLSDVTTYEEAVDWMSRWRDRIQDNPEVWGHGPEDGATLMERLISELRDFFDENGAILQPGG